MALPVKKVFTAPLYAQIRDAIREDVQSGEIKPGEKLLSENELAEMYGVSRMTIRQAISELINEGILYSRQGVGTFVSNSHLSRMYTHLTNFLEDNDCSCKAELKLIRSEVKAADSYLAEKLKLKEGEPVFWAEMLKIIDGTTITHHFTWVPYRLFPRIIEADLEAKYIWDYIEEYGYKIHHAVQHIEARLADRERSHILRIPEGAAVLWKFRVVYAEDGTPVEYSECFNRGDRYNTEFVIYR